MKSDMIHVLYSTGSPCTAPCKCDTCSIQQDGVRFTGSFRYLRSLSVEIQDQFVGYSTDVEGQVC